MASTISLTATSASENMLRSFEAMRCAGRPGGRCQSEVSTRAVLMLAMRVERRTTYSKYFGMMVEQEQTDPGPHDPFLSV